MLAFLERPFANWGGWVVLISQELREFCERWRAISVDDKIDVDENVEILGVEGLTLRVKRKGADIA